MMRALIWLRRIGHCRGFGIQSPTDYHFVREVVNEQWPYYAYSVIGQDDDWLRRKIGRLCLRLANHLQPKAILDLAGYGNYLQAGCRNAKLYAGEAMREKAREARFIVADASQVSHDLLDSCLTGTTLLVAGIGTHQKQWATVMGQKGVTVTFDLYYCGIATFNADRAKQNYIINF